MSLKLPPQNIDWSPVIPLVQEARWTWGNEPITQAGLDTTIDKLLAHWTQYEFDHLSSMGGVTLAVNIDHISIGFRYCFRESDLVLYDSALPKHSTLINLLYNAYHYPTLTKALEATELESCHEVIHALPRLPEAVQAARSFSIRDIKLITEERHFYKIPVCESGIDFAAWLTAAFNGPPFAVYRKGNWVLEVSTGCMYALTYYPVYHTVIVPVYIPNPYILAQTWDAVLAGHWFAPT